MGALCSCTSGRFLIEFKHALDIFIAAATNICDAPPFQPDFLLDAYGNFLADRGACVRKGTYDHTGNDAP
jgi:hypothetical protein